MKPPILAALFALVPLTAIADIPQITLVNALQSNGTWRFDVTVLHADEGWDHYADGWGIYSLDGTAIAYRILTYPHVNARPFTRSLSGVVLPEGTTTIILRPHDLVHGDGPDFVLSLEQ
ncbi:MAG: hypothetical protein AAED33_06645 [Paracoccaceae bacterium]|jgi:hypothetical protein